jgi:hypothetical protein
MATQTKDSPTRTEPEKTSGAKQAAASDSWQWVYLFRHWHSDWSHHCMDPVPRHLHCRAQPAHQFSG